MHALFLDMTTDTEIGSIGRPAVFGEPTEGGNASQLWTSENDVILRRSLSSLVK